MKITADARRGPLDELQLRWLRVAPEWRWAVRLYSGFAALFTFWCAWVSSAYPKFVEEAGVAVWPPSASLAAWLERVVLLPLYRYDVVWYVGIARQGYSYHPGATAFQPLAPLLIGLLGRVLGGNFLLAGWLISQVCCVAMLALLYRLVRLDYDAAVAQRTTLFLMASPLGFALLLPYNESLLLLCIVGAVYAARREHWWLAGLAGAAAVLTKLPGMAVLPLLVWQLVWQRREALRRRELRPLLVPLAGLALVPLGLLFWLVYRASLGDVGFSWTKPASLLNALLVTPSYQDVWNHRFAWPWDTLRFALARLQSDPSIYLMINLFVMLIAFVIMLYGALKLRPSYVAFSLPLAAMNLSILFPMWPLISVVRRFTIIFPIFIVLAVLCRSRAATALLLLACAPLWVLISMMYVRNAFIP